MRILSEMALLLPHQQQDCNRRSTNPRRDCQRTFRVAHHSTAGVNPLIPVVLSLSIEIGPDDPERSLS